MSQRSYEGRGSDVASLGADSSLEHPRVQEVTLPLAWAEGLLKFWPASVYAGRQSVYGEKVKLEHLPTC